MRARKYNKRIELWQTESVEDEYGGFVVNEVLISKSWCKIITNDRNNRSTDFGITTTNNTIVVQLRKRNDLPYNSLNQFFKYRGERYTIQGTPINIGFEDREIQITLTSDSAKSVEDLLPIT
jgi:SPP1 family predicted phage head-tail adaptor